MLLAQISELVSDLKPCLMMSPLTVSHFLLADTTVRPRRLRRGIAGAAAGRDQLHLPRRAADRRRRHQAASADAVLPGRRGRRERGARRRRTVARTWRASSTRARRCCQRHPLQWHYRSRHEDLIAFSNEHIYDGLLVTFPAADAGLTRTRASGSSTCPTGVYDRGRDGAQPTRGAGGRRARARTTCERGQSSVGVIAFNVSQANAIGEELDRLRVIHPELEAALHRRPPRRRVRQAPRVGAGRRARRDRLQRRLRPRRGRASSSMNFGPLNKEGGHRRLNVAVTRARELVEVVSSVRSSDFTLSENGQPRRASAARLHPLRGDRRCKSSSVEEMDEIEYDSDLEAAVAEAVRRARSDPGAARRRRAHSGSTSVCVMATTTEPAVLPARHRDGWRVIPPHADRARPRPPAR